MKIQIYVMTILSLSLFEGCNQQKKHEESTFKLTTKSYSEADDLNQIVNNEFGPDYRIADWNDVVEYCNKNSPDQFIQSLNLKIGESNVMVTWNNQYFWNQSNRHFFLSRFDHNTPGNYLSHANIDNHHLDLGSWFGLKMPILCKKK